MLNKDQLAREQKERGDTLFTLFVLLLLSSIFLYLVLHWRIPTPGLINPETQARDTALKTIVQATNALSDIVPLIAAQQVLSNTTTNISSTLGNAINVTTSTSIDTALAAGSKGLDQTLRSNQKTQIQAMLPVLSDSVRSVVLFRTNSVITSTLKSIEEEIAKPEPQTVKLQFLFEQLDAAIKNNSERYFWSDGFGRWVEFLFWGWFGTLVFLLMEIRFWYPLDVTKRHFIEFTPWYIEVALRGPLTSLLIMFFLTNVEVGALGATFSLKTSAIELQIFVAAILGYYSRIAKTELDTIVRRFFPDAWKENQEKKTPGTTISIEPTKAVLPLGRKKLFEIVPPQTVKWQLESQNLGDLKDGLYTAPTDATQLAETAIIKATSVTDKTQVAVALVTIIEFTIDPPTVDVKFGETRKFIAKGGKSAKWSVEHSDFGKINQDTGIYEAPNEARGKALPDKTFTITATLVEDPRVTAEAKVTLKL